jgi:hypothetical protein
MPSNNLVDNSKRWFAPGLLKKSFLTAKNTKPACAKASAGKINAKYAKVIAYISALCDLCVKPLRPLRLMDFDFFNTPSFSHPLNSIKKRERSRLSGMSPLLRRSGYAKARKQQRGPTS